MQISFGDRLSLWSNSHPYTTTGKTVQFSSVAQSCLTLCDPVDCSTPDFPVHHQLLEKTIPLTIWTFVSKVMSLLFNVLSRFVIAFLPGSKHLLKCNIVKIFILPPQNLQTQGCCCCCC